MIFDIEIKHWLTLPDKIDFDIINDCFGFSFDLFIDLGSKLNVKVADLCQDFCKVPL